MSHPVAEAVWKILQRAHHRHRWEEWSRNGAVVRRKGADELDGAQSSIAWVVDDFRYDGVRNEWNQVNSSPSARAAVQRFFRSGATPLKSAVAGPIEGCTRSKILIAIVNAFEFDDAEIAEVRDALLAGRQPETWHMGQSIHTWEIARSDEDLRQVVQLSRQVIGGSADFKAPGPELPTLADIAPLRRRLDIRADALELCLRHELDQDVETLVGYLLAYPLDSSVTARILAGDVTGADQFADRQIATSFADENSLYIGMVLGADLPSRAAVMERCIARVTSWAAAHPEGRIFAKRSTDDGERWLEHYGFMPVGESDGIWLRDPTAPGSRRRRRRLAAVA